MKKNIKIERLPDIKPRRAKYSSLQQNIIRKMEDFYIKGAVRIISSNDSVASINNENYKQLLNMHPKPSCEKLPDPPNGT